MTFTVPELQAGQTAIVRITKDLEYRITNTGWVLDISSNQPLAAKPESETKLSIVSLGDVQEDEV